MNGDFSNARVWQIGGGSAGKSCAEDFLRYGVALIGPGDLGPWPGAYAKDKTTRFIRQFAEETQVGDILLLRQGRSAIRAVGIVASEYMHLPQFEDVDGWDLQHARRVRWFALPEPYRFPAAVFGANPTRFSRVSAMDVVAYARRFVQSPPTDWQVARLPELLIQEPDLDPIPRQFESLMALARDLVPLYWNPPAFSELPTEDELIGHFVIPFLHALGWPKELIGIKWRRVDVALFNCLPRKPDNVRLVIEAKRFDTGFEVALAQARGYLRDLKIQRDVMVTDEVRYRLYAHEKAFTPVAYANLFRLKTPAQSIFENIKKIRR